MSNETVAAPAAPALVPEPYVVQTQGSKLASAIMRSLGWQWRFEGLPAKQGVIMVYPHTSNWDFPLGLLAKWSMGLPVRWWAKDSLFKWPLFGRWARWLGGIPVRRSSANGVVGDTAAQMREAAARGDFFWLALAPEGTRSFVNGWRSGAYHVALQAGVPVGLASLDYATRTVSLTHFIRLSGEPQADFALMAQTLVNSRGLHPDLASPVRLKS